MAEFLGLGITHQPPLAAASMGPRSLHLTLKDPGLPEHLRVPSGWPDAMRREWADDEGARHGGEHRDAIVAELRRVRGVLDAFDPDVVVIWGDDQYENFREDVVPAFCILAYDAVEFSPWVTQKGDNYWHEPKDKSFKLRGHRAAAKHLATGVIRQGFDVAYAYQPLHKDLGHAFSNSVLYLDWDRSGFDHCVVPISVNCYGRRLIVQQGYLANMGDPPDPADFDPPSPSPARCFDFGAACARALADTSWRVAFVASSSWSHAFLTEKHHFLYPDHEADRALYSALVAGDYDQWRSRSLDEVEDSGQQELLNWFCLAGAVAELGLRTDDAVFIESSVMNSNKVIASFGTQ
ncbi:MAG TPA: extradiol ring-cleavage dioxygenase [Alphaproteobacteria bacterium]|nr:extradiol ring-cleavage dioxygenase [Alphaproteobacteria bacterium]